MISITQKQDCCGCNACAQICPKQCITMQEDNEGFLYPRVDTENCIDCHLCEKTCPVSNHGPERKPLKVYAAINKDEEIRKQSSSGGIFTALAEQIIKQGGVVFGARFDERWQVKHDYAETMEGLAAFRGSKYVQSRIGNTYQEAERFLKAGRKVLFSGTPCQIAGLRNYLRKEYDNLLTVDFICHGVPSPMVWRRYLKEEIARQCEKNTVLPRPIHEEDVLVEDISFRDKTLGWKKYSFALALSTTNGSGEKFSFCFRMPLDENVFLRGFLADLYLRPSCHACSFRCGKCGSDVTLGDFWGLQDVIPEWNDDKGVTALLVNSERGVNFMNDIAVSPWLKQTDYSSVLRRNPALEKSVLMPKVREYFFETAEKSMEFRVKKYTRPTLKQQILQFMRTALKALKSLYGVKCL